MKSFQERVVNEKNELDEKIDRLTMFVKVKLTFAQLPMAEQERLERQLALMESYSGVLSERIANFTT